MFCFFLLYCCTDVRFIVLKSAAKKILNAPINLTLPSLLSILGVEEGGL